MKVEIELSEIILLMEEISKLREENSNLIMKITDIMIKNSITEKMLAIFDPTCKDLPNIF